MRSPRDRAAAGVLLLAAGLALAGCVFDPSGTAPDSPDADVLRDSGWTDGGASDAEPADAAAPDGEAPVPSCTDGLHNGDETDVDCGGSCPTGCDLGEGCVDPLDCQSGFCDGTVCALPPCADGVHNYDELDVDCGGSCPDPCTRIFLPDGSTLAAFELNGDVTDSSGNGRDAVLLGGTFVPTAWGQGLALSGDPQGLDWSAYAPLMVHPYTVEMVLVPDQTSCWRKLFSFADNNNSGWYYCNDLWAFPDGSVGNTLPADVRHYLAWVSTDAGHVDVYYNGALLGNTAASFTAPPTDAVFFRDDSASGRVQRLSGVVDGLRISNVARTPAGITALQQRLDAQPYVP